MGHGGPGGFYSSVHKIKEHLDFLCCGAERGQSRGSYRSLSALPALWKPSQKEENIWSDLWAAQKRSFLIVSGKDESLEMSKERGNMNVWLTARSMSCDAFFWHAKCVYYFLSDVSVYARDESSWRFLHKANSLWARKWSIDSNHDPVFITAMLQRVSCFRWFKVFNSRNKVCKIAAGRIQQYEEEENIRR